MYQYIDPNYVGSYQLVSDSAPDPIQRFQPPSFYPQTSYNHLIDPYYMHQSPFQYSEYYHQYYTEINPYQQQHFAQYQQHVSSTYSHDFISDSLCNSGSQVSDSNNPHYFGFDSLLNSEVWSRSDFKSNDFATKTSSEKGRSSTYVISATDLDFIKNEVRRMILMIDRIQGSLENMDQLLLHSTKKLPNSLPWAARSSKLQSIDVVAYPKSFERPANLTTQPVSQNCKPLEVAAGMSVFAKVLERPTTSLPATTKLRSLTKFTTPVAQVKLYPPRRSTPVELNQLIASPIGYALMQSFRFSHPQSMFKLGIHPKNRCFDFGKFHCDDNLLGVIGKRNAHIVSDIMLGKNEKMNLKKCIFIFDPGGA